MGHNTILIIFGVTGDLARKKLFPALYNLIMRKKLIDYNIVGVGLEEASPTAIIGHIREIIHDADEGILSQMIARMHYYQLDVADGPAYQQLAEDIDRIEKKCSVVCNRIIYCAVAAHFFCDITTYISEYGIAQAGDGLQNPWHRVVYEKPFGYDLESAHEINECIKVHLNEQQIYRIDHYLTKELVCNILLLRFTNCVFEPIWNGRHIEQVYIELVEQDIVGNRAIYYDRYGALADVLQNHMLELLALVGMENPERLRAQQIQEQRAKTLEKVQISAGILGQYTSYQDEKGVASGSTTETYAQIVLSINTPRWQGVPFILKTGKGLNTKKTTISIKFKPVACLTLYNCPIDSNWLTISMGKQEDFALTLNIKKPGVSDELVPIAMNFCHSCVFGPHVPRPYEILLEDIFRAEQSASVRFDEIEAAWKVIEAIRTRHFPLYSYAIGSQGPHEAEVFEKEQGITWK